MRAHTHQHAAVQGVLHRIADQVAQDLLEQQRVGDDHRWGRPHDQPQAAGHRQRIAVRRHGAQQRLQRHRSRPWLLAAPLDARQVEQAVEQAGHRLAGAIDLSGQLGDALAGPDRRDRLLPQGLVQQLGQHAQCAHRLAQVMAGRGDEAAAGLHRLVQLGGAPRDLAFQLEAVAVAAHQTLGQPGQQLSREDGHDQRHRERGPVGIADRGAAGLIR